jgi:hypothetical protein
MKRKEKKRKEKKRKEKKRKEKRARKEIDARKILSDQHAWRTPYSSRIEPAFYMNTLVANSYRVPSPPSLLQNGIPLRFIP